jgi:hypothetical protein
MRELNIDRYLEEFYPYFLSLRNVDGYRIIDVEVPFNWDVGKLVRDLVPGNSNVQTILTENNEQTKMVAIVGSEKLHTFDLLFSRLEKIIKINQEREEKNRLFKMTVKKLEQLFIDSNLDQLQKLVIDVEEEEKETELGNTDNAEIVDKSNFINDSDEDVLTAVTNKKEQIHTEN